MKGKLGGSGSAEGILIHSMQHRDSLDPETTLHFGSIACARNLSLLPPPAPTRVNTPSAAGSSRDLRAEERQAEKQRKEEEN